MYIVTSKPKRTSLYEGVSQAMKTLPNELIADALEAHLPRCDNPMSVWRSSQGCTMCATTGAQRSRGAALCVINGLRPASGLIKRDLFSLGLGRRDEWLI